MTRTTLKSPHRINNQIRYDKIRCHDNRNACTSRYSFNTTIKTHAQEYNKIINHVIIDWDTCLYRNPLNIPFFLLTGRFTDFWHRLEKCFNTFLKASTKRPPSWWRHQMEKVSALLALCDGIPLKDSDVELWCFLWFASEQTVEQTNEMPVIWDAIFMTSLWWCCGHFEMSFLEGKLYFTHTSSWGFHSGYANIGLCNAWRLPGEKHWLDPVIIQM